MGAGRFNFDFKYVHAALEIDGKSYADVGVRYKGNGTYLMSMRSAKRSLKIDFDRFDEKQSFRGAKKLNLNGGPMDPTKAREVLAYWLFSKAGLPAPRTALAEVTLNVPGKFDGEFLGVYTVVEQVDKKFLKRHFGDASGLLLKPEGLRGLPHLGDDLALYEKPYNVKEGGSEEQWKRLHLLTRLVSKADEAEFRRDIEQVLDVDAFLRFLAMNTLLASFDGYIGLGHNYYLYLSPETNKFVFFPWDLDLSFGTFPMFGSPDQQVDLSINHPHVGDNKLIDRLLAVPAWKEAYHRHLRRMTDELFTADELGRRVTEVETALKDLLPRDKAAAEKRRETGGFGFGPPGGGGFGATPITLTAYVQRRADSVTRQLDGKHQGYVPQGGFGMPGGGGGPPPLGRVLTRPALQLGDADRDGKLSSAEFNAAAAELFKKWDTNGDGQLSEQELDAGITSLVPNAQRPGR
ncbi:MAG TPA: CotH kinase family protein, partial [Pirellulaceae bacterium]|nr:CotH kinase family protein [Pirellulaceae bacterium]